MQPNFRINASAFVLTLFLFLQFFAPGSPDYVVPLLPECLLIAAIAAMFAPRANPHLVSVEHLSFRKSEQALLVFILAVVLGWNGSRLVLSLLPFERLACSHAAPSAITRAECFLQAAYVQNYAVRQYTALLLALSAGGAAALATRLYRNNWKIFVGAIVSTATIHVTIGLMTRLSGATQILPKWLMVNSFGMERFTFVMPNPSWVWPQLAPAVAWCLWFSSNTSQAKRFLSLSLAAAISTGIFMSHQRGGLLLMVLLWGLWIGDKVWKVLSKHFQRKNALFAFFAVFALPLIPAGIFLLRWGTEAVGRGTFHDDNRWTMWKVALGGFFNQSPLWGFGYASWYSKFKEISAAANVPFLSFDTAHNLWVQILFEHGVIGFALLATVLLSVLLMAFRNCRKLNNGSLLVSLHALAFLCCSVVQEIDYIRPVLMTHALSWGAVLGMPYYLAEKQTLSADKSNYFLIAPASASPKITNRIRRSMQVLASGALILALATWIWFARGAYGFEGTANSLGPMARWLSATSEIPVFGPQKFWLFEADFKQKFGAYELPKHEGGALRIEAQQEDLVYLPLQGGSRLLPRRHKIISEPAIDDSIRQITANIVFPPRAGKSLLPLLLTRGATRPFQDENSSWVECERDCSIAIDSSLVSESALEISLTDNKSSSAGIPQWSLEIFSSSKVSLNAAEMLPPIQSERGLLNDANSIVVIPASKMSSPQARWILLKISSIAGGINVKIRMKPTREGIPK